MMNDDWGDWEVLEEDSLPTVKNNTFSDLLLSETIPESLEDFNLGEPLPTQDLSIPKNDKDYKQGRTCGRAMAEKGSKRRTEPKDGWTIAYWVGYQTGYDNWIKKHEGELTEAELIKRGLLVPTVEEEDVSVAFAQDLSKEDLKSPDYKKGHNTGYHAAKDGTSRKTKKPHDKSPLWWAGYNAGFDSAVKKRKIDVTNLDEQDRKRGSIAGKALAKRNKPLPDSLDPNCSPAYREGYQQGYKKFQSDHTPSAESILKKLAEYKKGNKTGRKEAARSAEKKTTKPTTEWTDDQWQGYLDGYDHYVAENNLNSNELEARRGFEAGERSARANKPKRETKLPRWSDLYWQGFERGYANYIEKNGPISAQAKKRKDSSEDKPAKKKTRQSKTGLTGKKGNSAGRKAGADAAAAGREKHKEKPEGWSDDYWEGYCDNYDRYIEKNKITPEMQEEAQARRAAQTDFARGAKSHSNKWNPKQLEIYNQTFKQLMEKSGPEVLEFNDGKKAARDDLYQGKIKEEKPLLWGDAQWRGYLFACEQYIAVRDLTEEDLEYAQGLYVGKTAAANGHQKRLKQRDWSAAKFAGYMEGFDAYSDKHILDDDDIEGRRGVRIARSAITAGQECLTEKPEWWSDTKWESYLYEYKISLVTTEELQTRALQTKAKDKARSGGLIAAERPENFSEEQWISYQKFYYDYLEKHKIDFAKQEYLQGTRTGFEAAMRGNPLLEENPKEWPTEKWQGYRDAYETFLKNNEVNEEDLAYRRGDTLGYSDGLKNKRRDREQIKTWSKQQRKGYLDGLTRAPLPKNFASGAKQTTSLPLSQNPQSFHAQGKQNKSSDSNEELTSKTTESRLSKNPGRSYVESQAKSEETDESTSIIQKR